MEQRSQVLIAAGGCAALALAIMIYLRTESVAGPAPVASASDVRSDLSEVADVTTSKLEKPDVSAREVPTSFSSEVSVDPKPVELANRQASLERLLGIPDGSLRDLTQDAHAQECLARALEAATMWKANAEEWTISMPSEISISPVSDPVDLETRQESLERLLNIRDLVQEGATQEALEKALEAANKPQ